MKNSIARRWISMAVIWCAAVALTWSNLRTANHIRSVRRTHADEELVIRFCDAHQEQMQRMREQITHYSITAPSTELGQLIARELIAADATAADITDLATEFHSGNAESGTIRLQLNFTASAPAAFQFIDRIESAHHFFAITALSLVTDNALPLLRCSIEVRCRIDVPHQENVSELPPLAQASADTAQSFSRDPKSLRGIQPVS